MNLQQGITSDELRVVFTEAGLADALFESIVALEGVIALDSGTDEEVREGVDLLAQQIFVAAILVKRSAENP
jgi:hypothetical protein